MLRFKPTKYGHDGSCMELTPDGPYVKFSSLPAWFRWLHKKGFV